MLTIEDQPHFPEHRNVKRRRGIDATAPCICTNARMFVLYVCVCVFVCACVLMMKRFPPVWVSGRTTNAKLRKRERKATESGDGRFLLRAAMDEGRKDGRGMGDGRDGFFGLIFGVKRGREEEKRKKKRGEEERERRNQESQSVSAPKWVRIFFPLFSLREKVSVEIKIKSEKNKEEKEIKIELSSKEDSKKKKKKRLTRHETNRDFEADSTAIWQGEKEEKGKRGRKKRKTKKWWPGGR